MMWIQTTTTTTLPFAIALVIGNNLSQGTDAAVVQALRSTNHETEKTNNVRRLNYDSSSAGKKGKKDDTYYRVPDLDHEAPAAPYGKKEYHIVDGGSGGGDDGGNHGSSNGNGGYHPMEPPLPGIMPGKDRPKIILAADVDYPPFAQLGAAEDDSPLVGFGPEFAVGLGLVCDIDVEVVQTQWSRCWNDDRIGEGIGSGEYHGCMTYTHAAGVRNRYLEFSDPILNDNKAAGILVRLDANGNPDGVDGDSNLDSVRVVDVAGFAPTAENLSLLTNFCTGQQFSGYEFVAVDEVTDFPNDDALRTLLSGTADAMFVYADQVERNSCDANPDGTAWDCTLWEGLGTDFAYIHTGHFGWSKAGTTLSISKKGSGLGDILNPCIANLVETEYYYEICTKYNLQSSCFVNDFFPEDMDDAESGELYNVPTNELTTSCSTGYCACPGAI